MNLLDWLLVAAVVLFGLAGWHRGFLAGVLSFAGFIGGGLLAAFLLPSVLESAIETAWLRVAVLGSAILFSALLGQFVASILGGRLRGAIGWHPVRLVDNAAGAALNVLALAVVAWIVATAVVYLPVSAVSQQISESRMLVALDSIVPPGARNAFGSLRTLVGTTDVPRIFSGLAQLNGPDVDPPDRAAVTPAVDRARASVFQVLGEADACGTTVRGSGFAVASNRVITNAHVVAGVSDIRVRSHLGDEGLAASVVYFDPQADIAVLAVPGLRARALALAPDDTLSGADAVVAGFPEGGPYEAVPARLRIGLTAVGDDIYGQSGVQREIYSLRADVRHGNSGGPLLRPDGLVLGMVFGADDQAAETGYALRAVELTGPIADSLDATRVVPTGDCHIRD